MESGIQRGTAMFRRLIWDRSVIVILVAGIVISIVSFRMVRGQQVRSAREEFRLASDALGYAVSAEIETQRATLRSLGAWIAATPDPPGPELERFTSELIRGNPGTVSLKWLPGTAKPDAARLSAGFSASPSTLPLSIEVFAPLERKTRGYAFGLFRIEDILARTLSRLQAQPIEIRVYDLTAPPARQFVYGRPWAAGPPVAPYPTLSEALRQGDFKRVVPLDAGGGEWAMVLTAAGAWKPAELNGLSWNIVATILLITGISAAYFHLHVTRARTDEERLHLQLRRAAEEALRISEERYALAARGSKDGLWDWDLRAGLVFYSDRWKSMLGLDVKAVGNSPEEWMGRIYPADRNRVECQIAEHCAGETRHFQSEYRILHNDGSYHWMLSRGVAVMDENGVATRLAGSQTDITESKASDALTGLASRILLDEKLQLAIDTMRTRPEDRFALLFLDLDRFKMVNDSLGHLAGDQLLLRVANRLLACVAEPPFDHLQSLVARLGGDEFAILLCGMSHLDAAASLANRVQDRMTPAFDLDGHQLFVSVSIGVRFGQPDATPETLLLDADTAMRHAKSRGKERYEVFVPAMRLEAVERLRLETDLRSAVERDEFIVYYQPKVCIRTGALVELEALVRWKHPERGLISPADFIPLAEETGLILGLGECVLRKACRQMTIWLKDFNVEPGMRVSVNLSFRQFRQPDLFERILGILEETGLPPERLSLEVTEGVLMDNVEAAVVLMNRLRARRIGLQLDDFGTGYSSLSYLRRLPFDGLKIDKSFVQETGLRQENAEIVGTIALLARTLGMKVVAEGVETQQQLRMLIDTGCDYAQGNLFSAAVDSEGAGRLFAGFRHILFAARGTSARAYGADYAGKS